MFTDDPVRDAATRRIAAEALVTAAARLRKAANDASPGRRIKSLQTNGFDDAGAFVAEDGAAFAVLDAEAVFAVNVMQIAVANAAGDDTHNDRFGAVCRSETSSIEKECLACGRSLPG